MPSHQFADTVFVRIFRLRRDELAGRKNQRQIAEEIGWDRPNNLSHALCGKTAFTLEQLPLALAAFEMSPHILKPMFLLAAYAYQNNKTWKGALPTVTDAGLEEVFPVWMKDTIGAVARMTPAELPDDKLRKLVATMEQSFAPQAEPVAEAA